MIKRFWAILIVMTLAAAACGGDSTETADTTTSAPVSDESDTTESPTTSESDEDFSGDDSGDFCETAREFEENDPFENLGPVMGPEFFQEAEEVFGEVISIAPDEIRPDFEASLGGIREMGAILKKYDYNFLDQNLGAEMDALDTTTIDAASDRIDEYLEDVCGIENALEVESPAGLDGLLPEGLDLEDLEGLDLEDLDGLEIDPETAQSIFDQFGIDEELAACLEQEFGSDFDFDSAGADPSFMTQEVCGTTIIEIISGIGQG